MEKYVFGSVVAIGLLASISAMAASPTASKSAAPPGTEVVDTKGTVVGNLFSQNEVTRQINGVWFTIPVATNGIEIHDFFQIGFYFTSANCSGTAYLDVSDLPQRAWPIGNSGNTVTIYYPTAPYQTLPMASVLSGQCYPISPPAQIQVGQASTTTLTAVPPFSVH